MLRQQSFLKKIEVCDDGWQDGQMGHEHMMPAHSNLSHCVDDSLRFRSRADLPIHSADGLALNQLLRLGVMASGNGSNFEAIQDVDLG